MSTFVIRDIEIDPFDPASVNRAIREIEMVRDKLIPAMEQLIRTLVIEGIKIARAQLFAFDKPAYDTGELYESLRGEVHKDGDDSVTGTISTDVFYAVYVEYGTGIYAANGNGRQTPWTYYNERIGRFCRTSGMPPRPFMYNTLRGVENIAEREGGRILAEYLA